MSNSMQKRLANNPNNGGSDSGGVQSIIAGDNITVDNTDPQNPVISSTGGDTLWKFDDADAGLPINVTNNTEQNSPVIIISSSDNEEVPGLYINSVSSTNNTAITIVGETVAGTDNGISIQAYSSSGSGLMINAEGGEQDIDITAATSKVIIRNLPNESDSNANILTRDPISNFLQWENVTQGFIPTSGTNPGDPITGNLEFKEYEYDMKIFAPKGDVTFMLEFDMGTDGNNKGSIGTEGSAQPILRHSGNGVNFDSVTFTADEGLLGNKYFNYTSGNHFVQKQYVDDNFSTLMVPVNYGTTNDIIKSSQVFTQNSGSGPVTINLLPEVPIGAIVFVSDLGNNASTDNITINSGVGNTILKGDGSLPDAEMLLDSSGSSYTLRKMTSSQWMVIGTNQ